MAHVAAPAMKASSSETKYDFQVKVFKIEAVRRVGERRIEAVRPTKLYTVGRRFWQENRRILRFGLKSTRQAGNCALDLGFFGRSYRPQVQGDAIVQYSRDHGRLAAPEPRGDFFSVKRRMFQADKGGGQRRQWRSPSADNRLFLN